MVGAAVGQDTRPTGRFGGLAIPLFGLWTLFVWGGRLRNLWNDPAGLSGASRWSLWGSVIFCVIAIAMLAVNSLPNSRLRSRWKPASVLMLAGFTTVVWLIRAVDIARGDHSIGFIVVHIVLALVSIGLAGFATGQALARQRSHHR